MHDAPRSIKVTMFIKKLVEKSESIFRKYVGVLEWYLNQSEKKIEQNYNFCVIICFSFSWICNQSFYEEVISFCFVFLIMLIFTDKSRSSRGKRSCQYYLVCWLKRGKRENCVRLVTKTTERLFGLKNFHQCRILITLSQFSVIVLNICICVYLCWTFFIVPGIRTTL